MKAYVISYTEEGTYKTMTLYVTETGKLEEFVDKLQREDCQIHEIKVAAQNGSKT